MEFFKKNTKIDFLNSRIITGTISIAVLIFSTITLVMNGLNWGLDFTGGTQLEIAYQQPVDLRDIRDALNKNGYEQALVQNYGTSKDVLINVPSMDGANQGTQIKNIVRILPGATVQRVEFIGPQVGQELMSKGMLAIIISVIFTMVYIAMRFEYRLAVCSAVALAHDPILILGIFSFYQLEFDLKALAALLAVIGYSLNDTIVVFDRVRENFKKYRKKTPSDIMNLSINQTLSRTIITSMLTLTVVVALYVYGGETLKGFSLTMILGVVFGTYSSIYVAGTLAITLGLSRADMLPRPKATYDDRP